jgi:hypothetical protein
MAWPLEQVIRSGRLGGVDPEGRHAHRTWERTMGRPASDWTADIAKAMVAIEEAR